MHFFFQVVREVIICILCFLFLTFCSEQSSVCGRVRGEPAAVVIPESHQGSGRGIRGGPVERWGGPGDIQAASKRLPRHAKGLFTRSVCVMRALDRAARDSLFVLLVCVRLLFNFFSFLF